MVGVTASGRVRATAVGWRAAAALARAGGVARVLAPLTDSVYLETDGELVWLGREGATLHGRAVLSPDPLPPAGSRPTLALTTGDVRPWRPPALELGPGSAATLAAGGRALVAALPAVGAPDGFGRLLVGGELAFPLDGAGGPARRLARACAADDADAATEAAVALLGLGGGLTPSGDDYVGGALFARALLARAGVSDAAGWTRAAETIRNAARVRTHPVSATLLGDLAEGHGHAPLHELAGALVEGAAARAREATRRLVRIGHSSGWDLLAGFVAGLGTGLEPGP